MGNTLTPWPTGGSSLKPCWGLRLRVVRVAAQGRFEVMVSLIAMRRMGSSLATVCILNTTHDLSVFRLYVL